MEQNKRRQVAKISVFITSIFVIFLSVTYAFINMTLVGTKRQVVTAGNLELELLEDNNNLTITNAMPTYDEVGMIQDAFTFRLINKTSTNTNYILKLVDITTGEKLDTSIVKYGLTKDGENKIQYLSNIVNDRIDKGVINGNQTIEYSLRLWIDSKVTDNNQISGKSLSYRIDVEASQKKQISYVGMMKSSGITLESDFDNLPTNHFYQYREQITSIIFEDTIHIPNTISEEKQWDVSALDDRSVMAYVEEDGTCTVDSTEVTAYKLHIQGNGKIYANVDSSFLFLEFFNLTTIENMSNFDTSNVTNMSGMFSECYSLVSLDVSNFDTSKVTDISEIFLECVNLTSLDISHFDTSNVTNMSHMFEACNNLTNLNVSHFDTLNVTDMSWMFSGCISLTSLDVSHFDTSNVTDMSGIFSQCGSLEILNLSNFNTSNVTAMELMFSNCSDLINLDLSNFNTTNVTNMMSMFSGCSSLINLDLSNFDASNVTDIDHMFSGCSNLIDLDLSNFNTLKVTNTSYMFSGCSSLTSLDLSNFDISNVRIMADMFNLVKNDCLITVKDETVKSWVLEQNSELTNVVVKSA